MAATDTTKLDVATRSEQGSRAVRRLRRSGRVPGVIYGGEGDPVAFEVDARILRNTIAHAHTVLELSVDGGKTQPVVIKDVQRHPVRGDILHADLLRIRMDQPIQTPVVLDLVGAEKAEGVIQGGVLSQETREVTVEALPANIPDVIKVPIAEDMQVNDVLFLAGVTPPEGVKFVDDLEATVIATITPPTTEPVEEEIETETERVGEAAERQAAGDTSAEAEQATGGETE
jgi:large subunit ribosomal protein L25